MVAGFVDSQLSVGSRKEKGELLVFTSKAACRFAAVEFGGFSRASKFCSTGR